jgi:hypothetical protein
MPNIFANEFAKAEERKRQAVEQRLKKQKKAKQNAALALSVLSEVSVGDKGERGEQGDKGNDGVDGISPTIFTGRELPADGKQGDIYFDVRTGDVYSYV